jgi:predicted peptidase
LPIWAFHARGDPIVEVEESIRMVEAVKKAGGNPKLTIYEHNSHDAWTETYNSNDWINWLLTHSNK